jgi:peptidoglycan hydrolase-like protein with peptidoglycan-binding domain
MDIRRGASGNDVVAIQTILQNMGASNVNIDGKFGPITEQAVMDFQWLSGLGTTGVVDDTTWAAMQTAYGQMVAMGGSPILAPSSNFPSYTPVPIPTGQIPSTGGTIPTISDPGPIVVPPQDTLMMVGVGLAVLTFVMVAYKNRMI